jgi:hypothetical protein
MLHTVPGFQLLQAGYALIALRFPPLDIFRTRNLKDTVGASPNSSTNVQKEVLND